MTVTVEQAYTGDADALEADTITVSFTDDVVTGSWIVMGVYHSNSAQLAPIASPMTFTGTATIAAESLAVYNESNISAYSFYMYTALYIAYVTTGGSCTVAYDPEVTGTSCALALAELSTDETWPASPDVSTNENGFEGNQTAYNTGDVTSTENAVAIGMSAVLSFGTETITKGSAWTQAGNDFFSTGAWVGANMEYRVLDNATDAADWTVTTGNEGSSQCAVVMQETVSIAPQAMHNRRQAA